MKERLVKLLSSYKTMVILLLGYAMLLATATLIEKFYGTNVAKAIVYYSPLLFIWHFMLILNFIFISIKEKLFQQKRWATLMVHLSFIVILLGAILTFAFGTEGLLHLREGEISDIITLKSGNVKTIHKLPFAIGLRDFRLTRYPGSQSPSSFESDLTVYVNNKEIKYTVFMNNVLDMKGYRFFQASYDKDEQGTILSVNQDSAGRMVSYSGYFLLFLGLVLSFFGKKSRFQRLIRELNKIKHLSVLALMILSSLGVQAKDNQELTANAIPKSHIQKFASIPIQSSNGRIMPISTFASEILRKVHKENSYKGITPEEFLLRLLAMPEHWIHEPFITDNKSYVKMFDHQGNYRFQKEVAMAYHKSPALRNTADKDIIKQDERVQLIHSLLQYRMLRIFPDAKDSLHRWYSVGDDLSTMKNKNSKLINQIFTEYLKSVKEAIATGNWQSANANIDKIREYQINQNSNNLISDEKLKTEVLYNKLDIFRYSKIGYLVTGGLLIFLLIVSFVRNKENVLEQILKNTGVVIIILIFIIHTIGLGLRWYISEHAPWSNSYETMLYVAWTAVLGGLLFSRRSLPTLAIASLFGGIILFVSSLNWLDPQISPLVPVLQSPWLMFHVAMIVAAYGFFGIGTMLGITNLILMSLTNTENNHNLMTKAKELSIINEMSLWIGLALMSIGTFLGAIWANESWGRYWSWDPKETWALITMIIYALVLHLRLMNQKSISIWLFNTCSQLSILVVLMTYFGVNYFLSGMHSYGNSDALSGLKLGYVVIAVLLFFAPIIIAFIKQRKNKTTLKIDL